MTLNSHTNVILTIRSVRVFADSFIALIIPLYISSLGFDAVSVGFISSSMLLGSAFLIGFSGLFAHWLGLRFLLCIASCGMIVSGLGWSFNTAFPVLMLISFFGSLNPHGGETNLFRPIEHAALASLVPNASQSTVFGYYSFLGTLAGALGAFAIGILPFLIDNMGWNLTIMSVFFIYTILGFMILIIYSRIPINSGSAAIEQRALTSVSRSRISKLTATFCIDAFGGGFVVNSLIILWLTYRFNATAAESVTLFFLSGTLAAAAQLFAAPLSQRVGLGGTMLIGHVPSSILLILAAFAPNFTIVAICLVLRGFLSQLDVPTRAAFVFSQVTPSERAAAISFTMLPFSLAAAAAPLLSGWFVTASADIGWHLIAAGIIRLFYAAIFYAFYSGILK